MEKYLVFEKEISNIKNTSLQNLAIECLNALPDYFYEIPASATGKYHPKYALGQGGLVRHVKATLVIAEDLFRNNTVQQFSDVNKDIVRVSLLLHDGLKCGYPQQNHTVRTHPLDVCDYLKEIFDNAMKTSINPIVVLRIISCIKSHMGEWNTDRDGKEVLPKPYQEIPQFVHLCDYLASRKDIEIVLD